MAMTNYPSSSKRPFPDVEVEVEGGNKRKRKLYQVFISHRGPETKHSLAHHMYDVLKLKGFEVFFDIGEMEAGGDISHQILEAISTSAVQIAIISPGFGESVWCLKELVMMMQKHTDGSSLVIPIFYEVEPADLRFYNDDVPFCERFRNKHVGRQSHETMEEWKMALKDLPNLSGFRWDEHKGKLVELVVQRVCDYTHHAHLHIPKHVIGIEKKLVETMEDIMKPQGKVTVVSITGIGGIGKTTFAKALFNHMCSQFDRHCFVDDVKGLLEKSGIVYIQKLLLEGLLNLNIPIPNSGNGQYELNKRLGNQKVLLVLDNIDKTVKLNDIFPEGFAILCPSSIIIITSRVTCVFKNDYKIIPVELPKLDFEKSERLFCSQAFGDDESKIQEEHHILVRQIVQKCDGIPLALVLFGKHMSELDPSCWTDFLGIHRDSLPSDLSDCLRITYDSLDDLQKTLFLDVAIFFHGEEVRPVRNLWDDRASEFKISLDGLKGKLLIEVTEVDRFRMHDILRDLGRTIVDNEDKWNPGCRSRLWRREDIVSVLSEGRGTDKVQALSLLSEGSVILDADEDGNPRPWKVDAFSTMSSLKRLFLHGNCIEGDLSKLPKGLEFLRWTVFPFDAVSIPLKVAKVVDFSDGRQKRLWDLQSMEAPKKLTELGLRRCGELEEIRWDKKFSLLKYLDLTDCPSLRPIADNFSILQRLECLTLSLCRYLESLPESFSLLTNLRELNLSSCEHIKELPESFGQLTNLQVLALSFCDNIKELPESFGQLTKLWKLDLSFCEKIKELPESFSLLTNLRELNLSSCEKIKELPESFGQLTNLQELDLSYNKELKRLPESFDQLTNLQELDLSYNEELKRLPESFGRLGGLNYLSMEGCTNLEMLPDSFGQLKNLCSEFFLCGCEKLKKLPVSFGNLQQLQYLSMGECRSLEMLPDSFGELTNLQKLDLSNNKELKKLPESFGRLGGLYHLCMNGCTNLEMLPDSFGQLTNLRELSLELCCELKKLPENFGQLKNLSEFSLYGCEKLKKLPVSFGDLQQLQDLKMGNCWSPEMLPDSFGQLTNLQKLDLSDNEEFKKLPEFFGKLDELRYFFGQLAGTLVLKTNSCIITKIVHGGRLQGFHELKFTEAWPIMKLVLIEDNPERRPVLSRVLNNHFLNNHFLEELPLFPITIMDGSVSGWLPCVKMLDELTSKGAATLKFLFRCLKPSPSSSTTRVADGEHCKFKCIGAAIWFDFDPLAFGQRKVPNIEFNFGCTKWDPIYYTTGGGTSLFCMAVYDSPEEISLDKMSVCLADESLQGIGWVCYFLERDEDLLRRLRNSFALEI